MHELGLCEGVLEAVERRAAGRRVTRVRVRVGARHRVVAAAFDQSFALVAQGTVADGAAVDLVTVPVRVSCLDCGHQAESSDALAACPSCGGLDLESEGGDELILEAIYLDEGSGGSSSEAPEGSGRRGPGNPEGVPRSDKTDLRMGAPVNQRPGSIKGEDDVSRHPG